MSSNCKFSFANSAVTLFKSKSSNEKAVAALRDESNNKTNMI